MPQQEQPVALQTDTISQVPGGGARTITVTVLVNGVPTPVQMQVVCIADANGVIFDQARDDTLREVCEHLKDMKQLLARHLGEAFFEQIGNDNIPS